MMNNTYGIKEAATMALGLTGFLWFGYWLGIQHGKADGYSEGLQEGYDEGLTEGKSKGEDVLLDRMYSDCVEYHEPGEVGCIPVPGGAICFYLERDEQ